MSLTPEQQAREHIDAQLTASGWVVQSVKETNVGAALGVAIREYQTDVGPADYILFVKPRALVQMATGSGKTFTAITFIYRLLKFAGARQARAVPGGHAATSASRPSRSS
jgi:type I site-specific restriction endonuclease